MKIKEMNAELLLAGLFTVGFLVVKKETLALSIGAFLFLALSIYESTKKKEVKNGRRKKNDC